MASAWYVLQVYSGHEQKVEKLIRMKLSAGELNKEIVKDIKIPVEQVVEVKDGKKRTQNKKYFPGYILIELDLPELEWKETCSTIKALQGVTGFISTFSNKKPIPLSAEEARKILQKTGELKGEKTARTRQTFMVGEMIKITGGPFESFTGSIEEVNAEKNKLKVMVGIFGRNTPVEVDIIQVEKIS